MNATVEVIKFSAKAVIAMAAVTLLAYFGFRAIDRQQAFNEQIHSARCATGKYPAGYCKAYTVADIRSGK